MQKNAYTFIILLLLTSLLSRTVADSDNPPENNKLENNFTNTVHLAKKHINYIVRDIRFSLTTLPATILKNSTKVPEFIFQFIENAGDFMYRDMSIDVKYYLYTPQTPRKVSYLHLSYESFQKSTFNASLETKFLIHGFRELLPKNSIVYDIKDQLLLKGNYNIIIVDWRHYSKGLYDVAATNAVYVGLETAKFMKVLALYKGINTKSFHLIAYGVGCHVAGYIGKLIPNIGRITALDASGLPFEDLPSNLRITDTDANFVDAIHTDGAGMGTLMPYGDIDFFPNGGSAQPGCSLGDKFIDVNKNITLVESLMDVTDCNYQRALYLFMESINECRFRSVWCESYQDFENGKCPRQTSRASNMGFHAKPIGALPPQSTFYLETTDTYPFCLHDS